MVEKESELFQHILASEKWILLGKMASGLAHELNNPIMIIQNYVSLLLEDVDEKKKLQLTTSSEYYTNFQDILIQCQRLSSITKNLLEFSRTSSQKPKPYDIETIMISVLNLMDPILVKNQIQVQLNFAEKSLRTTIILDELQQIFLNLIDNAIYALISKYPQYPQNPHEKSIQITLNEISNDESNGENSKKYVQITVIDDGIGINPTDYSQIFEPFFTTKKGKSNLPESQKHQGLGLGLPYCKHIIEKYGGKIEFQSEINKFTRFIITLPLTEPDELMEEIVF